MNRSAAPTSAAEDAYLRRLGERVREERARRGMTRKMLARDSGLSERYLAQLEGGHGNVSIKLLLRLGEALNLPLPRLVGGAAEAPRDEMEREPGELRPILDLLRPLSPDRLAAARNLLSERFGTPGDADRRGCIALVGLRGAGKSTLGSRLAAYLEAPFIELDSEIERDFGLSLGEIFALYGQAAYRRSERRALDGVLRQNRRFVLAAGGSIVAEPATYEELLARCFTVWIKASPAEHMSRVIAQGDFRPMADNKTAMADLERILAVRSPLYARAHAIVDTAGRDPDASFCSLTTAIGTAKPG